MKMAIRTNLCYLIRFLNRSLFSEEKSYIVAKSV